MVPAKFVYGIILGIAQYGNCGLHRRALVADIVVDHRRLRGFHHAGWGEPTPAGPFVSNQGADCIGLWKTTAATTSRPFSAAVRATTCSAAAASAPRRDTRRTPTRTSVSGRCVNAGVGGGEQQRHPHLIEARLRHRCCTWSGCDCRARTACGPGAVATRSSHRAFRLPARATSPPQMTASSSPTTWFPLTGSRAPAPISAR